MTIIMTKTIIVDFSIVVLIHTVTIIILIINNIKILILIF